MANISTSQLRKIFVLSKKRGIDNELLHLWVYKITKKKSLKNLTVAEAIKIIDALEGKCDSQQGRVTQSQLNYIYGLAKDLGWIDEEGKPDEERLVGFVKERFSIDKLNWLTDKKASQVIEALKAMKKRAREENVRYEEHERI